MPKEQLINFFPTLSTAIQIQHCFFITDVNVHLIHFNNRDLIFVF
ncbi:hypothetical protein MmTuc01_2468 [Methanosarcina mazei Tuc01]|uniref:Uncharacterized protein n=1 Tax=Methanosarcina mazei Tuc01 TaxID=1236903 RepID=M1QC02_METMZ|nr:hypothetical protein MmTuc01_2468 [Methanosarcina mazei Tuc01]